MTPQMAILLLFNDTTEMNGAAMLEALQIKKEHLVPQLASLVKVRERAEERERGQFSIK